MIARLDTAEQLSALPEKGIEAQKIRALLKAYGTSYDFCRFFSHWSAGTKISATATVAVASFSNSWAGI